MAGDLQPIQTRYGGCLFRSRLEARWAVFFDALGVEWEYEKEGFDLGQSGYYLPDFWIEPLSMWVEVKGGPEAEVDRACRLAMSLRDGAVGTCVAVVWGRPGQRDAFAAFWEMGDSSAGTSETTDLSGSVAPGFYLCPKCGPHFAFYGLGNGCTWSGHWPHSDDYVPLPGCTCYAAIAAKYVRDDGYVHGDDRRRFLEECARHMRLLQENTRPSEVAARSARFEHGACGA